MTIEELNINSATIPFVGTLNDDDMAIPRFYRDEKNVVHEVLEETPAIKMRKDRMRHYLRYLPVRFLQQDGEKQRKLLLYAIFVTCDWRPIDATNVLDLIQNAGNKIIWNDDSQFIDVVSQRVVEGHTKPEMERTVVYVEEISETYFDRLVYRFRRIQRMNKDYEERFNVQAALKEHFTPAEFLHFCRDGFWVDDRFRGIPALAANYQQWLTRQHANVYEG